MEVIKSFYWHSFLRACIFEIEIGNDGRIVRSNYHLLTRWQTVLFLLGKRFNYDPS